MIKEYKECKNCKETFHLSRFNKSNLTKDGREGTCRTCRKDKRKRNAEAYNLSGIIKTEKNCSKCKGTLPIANFSRDRSRDDGLSAICKSCKSKTYAEYSKSPDARAAARRRAATWREENPGHRREYYQKTKSDKLKKAKLYNNSPDGRYVAIKSQAKHRGISFNLSKEFVSSHWNSDCNYCGEALDMARFDRIDSSLGYTEGNVVPCCSTCNYIKGTHETDFLKSHLEKMVKNMGNA